MNSKRICISLPVALSDRLTVYGGVVNVSATCARALAAEIDRIEREIKDAGMSPETLAMILSKNKAVA